MHKIDVAVLGATGRVGQEYIEILKDHPWFRLTAATGNTKVGSKLGDLMENLPAEVSSLEITESHPSKVEADLIFSPLPTAVARETEIEFAKAGFRVITDASPHRMDSDVPLIVPEVNPDHLDLISDDSRKASAWRRADREGFIVATPNCTTIGLAMTLKPLNDVFQVNKVVMTSFQALSGAGYPGVSSLDIEDNIIPFIDGEEEKVVKETNKILGRYSNGRIIPSNIELYCSCNRVAVLDGHLESVYLESKLPIEDATEVLENFVGLPQKLKLPSAPEKPIIVKKEKDRPQPRLDRMSGRGMSIVVGRLRMAANSDPRVIQYHLLSHNTIRGAAGGAVLTAELLVKLLDIAA